MASTVAGYASHITNLISTQWTRLPRWAVATTISLATLLSVSYTRKFINDFHAWKRMGVGGLPHNLTGFMVNVYLTVFHANGDTIDSKPYQEPETYAPGFQEASENERIQAQKSFFSQPLTKRIGQRTRALKFAVPQRQRNAHYYQNPKVQQAYIAAFQKLGTDLEDTINWRASVLEGSTRAMFLKSKYSVPTLAAATQGEICHIHESDLSGHVTLSFVDAEEVISKGWGERHQLSGSKFLNLGYTMLYIPRTVEEVETFIMIYRAGVEYMRSSGSAWVEA